MAVTSGSWAPSLIGQYQQTGHARVDPRLPAGQKLQMAEQVLARSTYGVSVLNWLASHGKQISVVPEAQWPGQYQAFWGVTSNSQTWVRESVLSDPVAAALLIAHETTHAYDQSGENPAKPQAALIDGKHNAAWTETNAFTAEATVAQQLGIPLQYAGTSLPPNDRPLQDKAVDRTTGAIRNRQQTLAAILADPRYDGETEGVQPYEQL
jgi:hypothetical protein